MAAKGSTAAELRRIARATRSESRQFVDESVKSVSKAIDTTLAADTGGDRVLSGTTRRGKVGKLRVQTTVKGDVVVEGKVTPGPNGRSIAVWDWLEDGTEPHRIGTGQHPGTKAKHTWTRAAGPELDALQKDIQRRFERIIGG